MPDKAKPLVEFQNVSLRYGDAWALKNVSFTLKPGDTRIILGAAGSGKTTLLKTVIGLVRADEGEIRLFGEDVRSRSEVELFPIRSRAGFVLQEGGLFDSLTIGENVRYPLENRQMAGEQQNGDMEARVRDALRFVELEHTINSFPSQVSGGMRRRVGIARAIVTEPPLVLYDSPTAGLDPITANTIMALVAKERDTRNSGSLIVTHRYQDGELMANFRYRAEDEELIPVGDDEQNDAARTRTKFMVMREGEIIFSGNRHELEASEDEYVRRFVRHDN